MAVESVDNPMGVGAHDETQAGMKKQSGDHWQFASRGTPPTWLLDVNWFNLDREPKAERIKHNDIRDVYCLNLSGETLYAKHLHTNGLIDWLRRFVGRHPALREWQASQYAKWVGINAVEYIAWGRTKRRRKDPPGGHVLISGAINANNLNQQWPRIRQSYKSISKATDALVELFHTAHKNAFQHGDPHPENILISKDFTTAWFIDLQHVRYGRDLSRLARARDLVKLNQWFRHRATRAQRLRFLVKYLDRIGESSRLSEWSRLLTLEARRHAKKLADKRDGRIWGDNRYYRTVDLDNGWQGHVVIRYRRRPMDSQFVETSVEEQRRTLNDLISGREPAPPLTAIRIQTDSTGNGRLRNEFEALCRDRHRDKPVDQPLAYMYRESGGQREEILLVEPVGVGLRGEVHGR